MVLFAPIIKRRIEEKAWQEGWREGWREGWQEGWKEGLQEARREKHAEWEAWLKRSDEAQANGQPFDEPSPSQLLAKNDDP